MKAPILNRELYYDRLNDGTLRLLDWCLVNTELGAMVEPRGQTGFNVQDGLTQLDIVATSFSSITEMDEDKFYSLTGTGGRLIPVSFDY